MDLRRLDLNSDSVRRDWEQILAAAGLRPETAAETWGLYDDNQLAAVGSRTGNILKCLAVAPEYQAGKAFDLITAKLLQAIKEDQMRKLADVSLSSLPVSSSSDQIRKRADVSFLSGPDQDEREEIWPVPGWDSVFVYTKAASAQAFSWLGFEILEFVDNKLVLMEKTGKSGGLKGYLDFIRRRSVRCLHRKNPVSDEAIDDEYLSRLDPASATTSDQPTAVEYDKLLAAKAACDPDGIVSALVMHANPFTLGHLYLAELAAAESSLVHLFVLSEESQDFPALDRLLLVKEATKHLTNLIVHPTGPYLVSAATFPSYFLPADEDTTALQATLDAKIFLHRIAPALRIRRRYLGTEPFNQTTELYNQMLSEVFGDELELAIVPRMETKDGRSLSATLARQAYRDGSWQELADLVPPATLEYLRRHQKATDTENATENE